jgi:hypothetical protein
LDQVVGAVLIHLEFFEHDALFFFQLSGVKHGVQNHVADDVNSGRHMLVQDLGGKGDGFLGGEGVEVPADAVDRESDVFGRAMLRALEHHVLGEMTDAPLIGRLMAGAAIQPNADGDGTDVFHRLGHDAGSVVENCLGKSGGCYELSHGR